MCPCGIGHHTRQVEAARRANPPLSHFKPSFSQRYPLLALSDDSDSEDEHDDSESDGGAGGGDEHDGGVHVLLLLPMTVLSLSQVKRSAADMPAISD